VEYRVVDARRVAMEFSQPLSSLWERAHATVGDVVARCTHDELRTRGDGIARLVLQRLQAMQLPATLGLEIFNVFVTSLQPTDAGASVLARQELKEYQDRRAWQTQNEMLANSQINLQWLAVNQPETYRQILAGNTEILKAFIERGGGDPTHILHQFASGGPLAPPMITPTGSSSPTYPSSMGTPQPPAMGSVTGGGAPQLGPGQGQGPGNAGAAAPDGLTRIREEVEMLRRVPGSVVEARAGLRDGLPDGTYGVEARVRRPSGGELQLLFDCSDRFPSAAPSLEVFLDEQPVSFNSVALRQWGAHRYLVEVVNEARQYFG
jgi:hypothetical protein